MPRHKRPRITTKPRKRVGYSARRAFWFDPDAAARAVEFIENFCHHIDGEWEGQPFKLQPWQREIVENFFGWKRNDAAEPENCTRQYRTLWLEVPRKNGKSTLAAALVLTVMFCDGEPRAQLYSIAADKEQASIVFEACKDMIAADPVLSAEAQYYGGYTGIKKQIVYRQSSYRALSADPKGKHGFNTHMLICDEVHEQHDRTLIDAMASSQGARRQPIRCYITTAGIRDRTSIAWEMHDKAMKVIDGSYREKEGIKDDSFLPYVFRAPEDADWKDERVWKLANPNLGVSPKIEFLRQECRDAVHSVGYENTFRRLYLNQWTEQVTRWISMHRWERCGNELPKEFGARRCWGGLDLASSNDIAAFVLAFEPEQDSDVFDLLCKFWVPEHSLYERVKRDGVRYDVWERQGLIDTTPGDEIDSDFIEHAILECADSYNLQRIAYDRWGALEMSARLRNAGLDVMPHGQGFAGMAAPTREFDRMIRQKRIRHGGNAVLHWMASNVSVSHNPAGDMKPDKEKSSEKIDGIVAAIMALGLAVAAEGDRPKSYLDEPGAEVMML